MNDQLTPQQLRRRRAAANELRERARQLLEDARMLDSYPAMHLTMDDMERIAQAAGIPAEQLYKAVSSLYPGRGATEADGLAATADTAEGQE